MITTYEEYLDTKCSLTLEDMQKIQRQMIADIGSDENANNIYCELMKKALRYASIRAEWQFLDREEKAVRDADRTLCHDSLIVKFNMLARYVKAQGKAASWRDVLGYEEDDRYNRKRIGDFACYLVFINSLNAR